LAGIAGDAVIPAIFLKGAFAGSPLLAEIRLCEAECAVFGQND
jgi:hypothetical protein